MAKHVIFGAGLIGCYLGACIQSKAQEVLFVARPSVADKLKEGILVTDYLNNETKVKPLSFATISSSEDSVEPIECDFLWITVKCTAITDVVEQIKPLVGDSTIILCCQNGLGSEAPIKEAFNDNDVLRVMVPFNVTEIKPGHMHRGSEGHLTVESLPTHKDFEKGILDLSSSLLPISLTNDMSALLWAKLQLNLGNAVNALADKPVKEMLEDRSFRRVMASLMDELLLVVKAQKIDLPKIAALPGRFIPFILRLPTPLFRIVAQKMLAIDPNVRASMWWDLSQGKLSEIDHLNGAVVRSAQNLGIKTPSNERIVGLVKEVERKEKQIGFSGEKLLCYVNGGD